MDAYKFWVKVFALTFALGVVSGITMPFQFGTNRPGFMETVGSVAGPLLAYEVLTAFFLEAVFPGILLFGFRKVPGWGIHAPRSWSPSVRRCRPSGSSCWTAGCTGRSTMNCERA